MFSFSRTPAATRSNAHGWHRKRLVALFFPFFFLVACAESSMAKYVVFSPITGKIVIAGKPATGVPVTRWYKRGNDELADKTTTDSSGDFSFPEVSFRSLLTQFSPFEVVITQRMMVTINGVETRIYSTVKRNYDLNGEYAGKALNFVFDPTATPSFIGADPSIRVTLSVAQ
jgi:hypothetical protein